MTGGELREIGFHFGIVGRHGHEGRGGVGPTGSVRGES
jgi:hypothetical protein